MGGCGNYLEYEERYRDLAARYKSIHEKLVSGQELTTEEKEKLEDIAMKDLLVMPADFNRALLEISKGKVNSENVKASTYEKEFEGVAQINIVMEEFHTIPSSK